MSSVTTDERSEEGVDLQRLVLSDSVTIYHGDCLDILPSLNGIDAVISDPPYGINWNPDASQFTGGEGRHFACGRKPIIGDDEPFDPTPWLGFRKVVLWGANYYPTPVGTTLVWIKRNEANFGKILGDAEIAWMKGGETVYCKRDVSMNGKGANFPNLHQNQKPVAIMAWCMDKAKVAEGETVIDGYMGSGTTGIACIRTGRNFIGIEKDPQHFETARQRLDAELAQGDLFRRENAKGLPPAEGERGSK